MTRVQADPALKEALTRNGERVEVLDEVGSTIGYAISTSEMDKLRRAQQTVAEIYARADELFDPEDLKAAFADPRCYSTEEVLQLLELE